MPFAGKPNIVDSPHQQLKRQEAAGMHIASGPKCVDGPRQQLTTRWMLWDCLLPAKPSALMIHANNSD